MSIESSSVLRIPGFGASYNPAQESHNDVRITNNPVQYAWQSEAPEPWTDNALCGELSGADKDRLFWPDNGVPTNEVKYLCAGCPVYTPCQAYGQRMVEKHGIDNVGIYAGYIGGIPVERKPRGPRTTDGHGEANNFAKLGEAQVYEIRRLYDAGWLHDAVADLIGTTRANVGMIGRRERWASLPEEAGAGVVDAA